MPTYFERKLENASFDMYFEKKPRIVSRFSGKNIGFGEHAEPRGIMYYDAAKSTIYIAVWTRKPLPQSLKSDLEEIVEEVMGTGDKVMAAAAR